MYTVCGSTEEALAISRTLVRERLCACTNYWEIRSVYEWGGRLVERGEAALLIKTIEARVEAVFERVRQLHPYELPCLLRLDPDGVENRYAEWIARGSSGAPPA